MLQLNAQFQSGRCDLSDRYSHQQTKWEDRQMGKPTQREKMSNFWLNVFNNSKINGAEYREDRLPSRSWSWPTDTYLQRRLRELRVNGADEPVIVAHNPTLRRSMPREEDVAPQLHSSSAPRRPMDNADRPNRETAQEKGLVIEWDDIDERLSWLARPSNN